MIDEYIGLYITVLVLPIPITILKESGSEEVRDFVRVNIAAELNLW